MANKLEVVISAVDHASKQIESISKTVQAHSKELRNAGIAVSAFGAVTLGALALTAKAWAEEEKGMARLGKAIENAGGNYQQLKTSIEATIEATQKKTGIADDAQREALAQLTNITSDYEKALALLPLTLDLAAGKGIDYSSAAMIVGRVSEGNTEILTRYGIQLKENATSVEALTELNKKFGGQAEVMGKTVSGQMQKLQNSFEDLKESIGEALAPQITAFIGHLNDLINRINKTDPETKKMIANFALIAGAIAALIGPILLLISALPALASGFAMVGVAIAAMTGPVGLIILGIAAITAAVGVMVVAVIDDFKKSKESIEATSKSLDSMGDTAEDAFKIVETDAEKARRQIQEFEKAQKKAEETFKKGIDTLDAFGNQIIKALKNRNQQLEKIEIDTINAQIEEAQRLHDAQIALSNDSADKQTAAMRRTADEQIRAIQSITNTHVKDVESQIEAIRGRQSAEDEAARDKEDEQKRQDLIQRLFQARVKSDLAEMDKIRQAQADLEESIAKRKQRINEAAQVAELRSKIDVIRETGKAAEDAVKANLAKRQEEAKGQLKLTEDTAKEEIKIILKNLADEKQAIIDNYAALNEESQLQAEARKLFLQSSNDELITLLNAYNPLWQDAGLSWGTSLLEGLNSEKQAIIDTINEIMAAMARAQAAMSALGVSTGGGGVNQSVPPGRTGFEPGGIYGPTVPVLAEGGIVRKPTLAVVGESGPEAIVPLGKTGGVTINFNGPVYGTDDFNRKVQEAVKHAKLAGGFRGVI